MALGAKSEDEEERSLRDDLASALKDIEAREASESTAAPEEEEAQLAAEADANSQPSEAKADRGDGRDAHGRFLPKSKEGSDPEAEQTPPDQSSQSASPQPKDESGETPSSPPEQDAPPKSWRADEAKAWATVPPEAKAAILRREAEAARLAGANDSERMFGREMADLWRPHIQEIQAQGATPQVALKALLTNHNDLRSNDPERKLGTARRLLHEYGIDPAQLAQIQPNVPSPEIVALQNEIAQLRAATGQAQQQQFAPLPPSVEEHNIMSEIEAFRADPAHPHFEAVHQTMGKLLETGAAPDLESAYHAAVAMTPALRSTATPPVPAADPAQKTAAARRAAASVTGSPGPTGNPVPMSLRDELKENLRSAGFSV